MIEAKMGNTSLQQKLLEKLEFEKFPPSITFEPLKILS